MPWFRPETREDLLEEARWLSWSNAHEEAFHLLTYLAFTLDEPKEKQFDEEKDIPDLWPFQ